MATRVAAEIQAELGQAPQLIEGGGGIFLVRRGETVVFDKKKLGRFPEAGEITRLLAG